MDPDAAVAAPPPSGFSETPPPPAGFAEAPPAPVGFSADNPLAPAPPVPPQVSNTEVPGFWSAIGSAFGRGVTERTAADIAGAQVALPQGLGGKTLEQTYQEGQLVPETADEITRLLGQKVNDGWSDPKWWGTHIAHGAGGIVPGLAVAVAGNVLKVPSSVGFGAEGGLGTLVPAYKAARAAGLDPDEATTRALTDSGIAAATATAMGLAPAVTIFGKIQNSAVTDQVAMMLKRPVMEMLAQLGIVQPGLAVTGHLATALTHGDVPDGWDLATTFAEGVGMGGAMVGGHATIRGAAAARRSLAPSEPGAGPAAIAEGFAAQKPSVPPPPEGFSEIAPGTVPPAGAEIDTGKPAVIRPAAPPAVPVSEEIPPVSSASGPALASLDETLYPRESRIFYSPVRKAIEEKLPDNASVEQTIATLRNAPGVKEEEMVDLGLSSYLAGLDGKVNKKDLLAHVEANGLILEEAQAGAGSYFVARKALRDFESQMENKYGDLNQASYMMSPHEDEQHAALLQATKNVPRERLPEFPEQVLPGEHDNYREFVLKTPARGPVEEVKPSWESTRSGKYASPLDYESEHWPGDINPLAHIRTTDRMDRNGRNLLHVEEIQSDLHQEGRKEGYQDPSVPVFAIAKKNIDVANKKYDDFVTSRAAPGEKLDNTARRLARDPEFVQVVGEQSAAWRTYQRALRNEQKVPDLPLKTGWSELAVKRILRLAADEGYDGVSWPTGDQIGLRLNNGDQLHGNRQFYDKHISSLFKKWAKKLGMDVGTTKLDGVPTDDPYRDQPSFLRPEFQRAHQLMGLDASKVLGEHNNFVEMNPAAGERIRQGLPLYETGPKGKITLSDSIKKGSPKELVEPSKLLVKALGAIGQDIKLSRGIEFVVAPTRTTWRGMVDGALNGRGEYVMRINTRLLQTPADVYATMGHELGHIIYRDKWAGADDAIKLQISEEFRKFRTLMNDTAKTVGDVRRERDNAVSETTGARNQQLRDGRGKLNDLPLSELQNRSRAYLLHFDEWFAEQVAKWATTSEKPLGRVEKFFKEVGDTIRKLLEKFRAATGRSGEATPVMQEWLNSLIPDATHMADVKDKLEFDTKRRNADALARDGTPDVAATPATASTIGGRGILDALPPDLVGSAGPAAAAHADRMNRFYEWMTSLPQIAELNKHIRGLQIYKEIVATMNIEKNNYAAQYYESLRQWKAIADPKQLFGLNKFIEDYMNGLFKDPRDTSGTIRRPTAAEFSALVAKHKLSDASVRMFGKLTRDFDGFLEQYRQLLVADAIRIKDPTRQQQAIADINKRVDTLLQRPYFPAMRFGKYTITVYDTAGNVRHFEQTETLRKQAQIKKALEKSTDLLPGDRVRTGEVPKDATPLLGMPPGLLDLMADKLDLSPTQKAMLDQLRFDYAPSQSFRHQFKTKDLTPGYSTDFQRAYANFFFHGANHITRVKWVDALRDQVREVKKGSIDLDDAVKRDRIANYMTQHLQMLVDPKPDFAALRGLMFHWYLGFNPASATLNLSQTPLMTFPHLASKFGGLGIGDARAIGAILKASSELNNFYKKGTILDAGKVAVPGPQGSKSRALAEAVKEGVISETQAHTLAAISEDRNLLRAFGSKAEEGWSKFSEASSWMFEMTEQYNRRVAFRAAWDLAMRDPNNKYVAQTVRDNPMQYERLKGQGWSHQEAAAFTAAKDSTEKTQFVYAPYARPKLMWGRRGSLFIFKSFVQNTLFNLYSNPAGAGRTLLILGVLGGMMGLPGTEDINGIIKALGWQLFGKDWDVEDQARKFAIDVLHGAIGPDMLLHGMSTKGFGIPAVMNAMGNQVGLPKWFPTTDRHNSIGMGNILPVEPGKMFGPSKDPGKGELAQLQRASGAGFSNIFALYNFLTSTQSLSDMKRWEGIMPRAASNVSHAFRYFSEGTEKNRAGNAVVRFDVHDTEQMAEILARAAGYQPRRVTAAWEAIGAKTEAQTYWDLRRQIILRQFGEAVKKNSPEDKARVLQAVKNYNQELSEPELKPFAITSEALKTSVMNRLQVQAKQEAGLPLAKRSIPLFRSMDKYFPEGRPTGQVDAKPVK